MERRGYRGGRGSGQKRGEPVPRLNCGSEVDVLKAAARPTHSPADPRGIALCHCKLQTLKYLHGISKEAALTEREGRRWLLRYWPEVTLHFRPVVFWGWARVV